MFVNACEQPLDKIDVSNWMSPLPSNLSLRSAWVFCKKQYDPTSCAFCKADGNTSYGKTFGNGTPVSVPMCFAKQTCQVSTYSFPGI